jgi:hypothetical protein
MTLKLKLVSFILLAVLVFSSTAQAFAATTPFKDIDNSAYKDKITGLQERGFIKGTGNGMFAPDSPLTAAQGIQLFVNVLNLNLDAIRFIKEPKATDYFKNANNDAWYANAFIIASVNSLDLPNDLNPDQEWTREEFIYYLVKSFEFHYEMPMIKLMAYEIKDEDKIEAEHSGAIQRALAYGFTKLDASGKFNPDDKITRAEAAAIIYDAINYVEEMGAQKRSQ